MNRRNTIKLTPDIIPAETFHPGEHLLDEIQYRKIKSEELAKIMGIASYVLEQILKGKKNITPQIAISLEKALDISAEFWMRLQVKHEIDTIRIKYRNMLNNNNINASKRKSIRKAIVSH
ncbi:MAG: HigA family addiction module antidote protein [Bacteroidetes bacterium]|nr:HigA family addiction module antidote protein [Bacteroidota bacterium]